MLPVRGGEHAPNGAIQPVSFLSDTVDEVLTVLDGKAEIWIDDQ